MLHEDKGFGCLLYSLNSNPLYLKEYRFYSQDAEIMRGHGTALEHSK